MFFALNLACVTDMLAGNAPEIQNFCHHKLHISHYNVAHGIIKKHFCKTPLLLPAQIDLW
jgi:hypothetical protein